MGEPKLWQPWKRFDLNQSTAATPGFVAVALEMYRERTWCIDPNNDIFWICNIWQECMLGIACVYQYITSLGKGLGLIF